MNHLPQIFMYQGIQVRTVMIDGHPWWVLKDVCDVLELAHRVVRQRLNNDVCSTYSIPDALGREQETTVINEDGMYDVILESRKPEAKVFRKWVTSEVLPSIRKTGTYSIDKSEALIKEFNLPRNYPEALRALADSTEQVEKLRAENDEKQKQLAVQEPKVAMYQMVIAADNTQPVGTVAKAVGMGRNNLFKFLREKGILMKNSTIPYQRYVDAGYFVVKEVPTQRGDKIVNEATTRVTAKGMDYIAKLVREKSSVV